MLLSVISPSEAAQRAPDMYVPETSVGQPSKSSGFDAMTFVRYVLTLRQTRVSRIEGLGSLLTEEPYKAGSGATDLGPTRKIKLQGLRGPLRQL